MTSHSASKHDFPMRFSLQGRTVVLRPLTADDREEMIAFAEALPEEDLLFLERDIAQPAEVDAWIKDTLEGRLVTLIAWEDDHVVGYSTFNRASARWMCHVAELRVVVAESARGIGVGRLLLELAFEMVLDLGVTKVIARMTPEQTGAPKLFQRLGFAEEAVLRDHALDVNGVIHDLQVLSFHTRDREQCCEACGIPVLEALVLDGSGCARIATNLDTASWVAANGVPPQDSRAPSDLRRESEVEHPSTLRRSRCRPVSRKPPALIRRIVQEIELASSQVQAVLRAGNLKCPSKPAGPREIGLPTVKWLSGADEHRLGFSHTSGHDVQHLVHPVDQVHVGPSCGAKQDLGSPRPPFGGVRCQIAKAEIRSVSRHALKCLSVHTAHEDLSDQRGSQLRCRSPEKRPREFFEGRF